MLSRRSAWAVAIVATLTMTVSYIDRSSLSVLGIAVSKALSLDETEFGWLASAFSIAYLVATPLAGAWIDRIGARRGLVISVLVWTAIAALHAVVPTFGVLFAMRIALGIAESPSFPGAAQTVQRILPPADRARGFGILFTGSSIGGMLVPPLASALFILGGWRVSFLGTALAGLLWVPAWLLVTRRPDVRAQLDTVGHPAGERTPRPPLRALLANRDMVRAWCAVLASAPLMGFVLTWGSKLLARSYGVEQGDVGKYLWLPPLLFDLGAITFGDLASRRRKRDPNASSARGLFAAATVLALVFVTLPFATTPWQAMLALGITVAGGGGIYTLATSELLARMPPGSVSFAGGTVAAAQSLILIIANPLVGASIDATGSYDVAIFTLTAWVLPGAILWIALRPR